MFCNDLEGWDREGGREERPLLSQLLDSNDNKQISKNTESASDECKKENITDLTDRD